MKEERVIKKRVNYIRYIIKKNEKIEKDEKRNERVNR
jgi:hypothetical protein